MPLSDLLKRLAAFEPTSFPFISLYLNAQPDEHGRDHFDPFVRREFRAQMKKYPLRSLERELFERDAERITTYLRDELRPSANGVAIFACAGLDDYLEAVQVDAPIEANRLSVSQRPQVYELERLNDVYQPYATLVADTNQARLFVFGFGSQLDEQQVTNPNVNRTMIGGWSQARFQRHVDNFYQQHAKDVTELLARVTRDEQLKWIVLAGDEVIIPLLRRELPQQLADHVIDVLRLDISTPDHEVKQASFTAVREQDARVDEEKIQQLFDKHLGGGLASAGVHDTLVSLTLGQVEELFLTASPDQVEADLQPGDASLLSLKDEIEDGGRGLQIADELVRRARQTDAQITFIENHALLAPHGGVAAKLRFSL